MDPSERGLVVQAWRVSYQDAPGIKGTPADEYFPAMGARIDKLLEESAVLVALHPEDSTDVVGFAVFDGPVLHYIYVKHKVRRIGIARELLKAASLAEPLTMFTHWSRPLRNPTHRIFRGMRFNPFRGLPS